MTMDVTLEIILSLIIILLICTSGVFSFSEIAFASANKIRMKTFANENNHKAKQAKRVLFLRDRYNETSTSIVILNNIVNILATTLSAAFFGQIISNQGVGILLSTILMSILIIFFGEIIPKMLARRYPESGSMHLSMIILIVFYIFYPISKLIAKLIPLEKEYLIKNEEEFNEALIESKESGVIDISENEIIKNTLMLDKKKIKDIMTNIEDVFYIDSTIKDNNFTKEITNNGFSRIPIVNPEGDTIGILNLKKFLLYRENKEYKNLKAVIEELMDDAIYVTKNHEINWVFDKLKSNRRGMAIVVEEEDSKKMIGIVTIEDIVEEIVGEIYDENDVEADGIYELGVDTIQISYWSDAAQIFDEYFPDLKKKPQVKEKEIFGEWFKRNFKNDQDKVEFKNGEHYHYENLIIWIKKDYDNPEINFEIDLIY